MLGFPKKDKITKLIIKASNEIYSNLKENNIDYLQAHLNMKEEIEKIYQQNNFYYQELLERKIFLTKYRNNLNNIFISFAFGVLSSWICSMVTDATKTFQQYQPWIYNLIMIIIVLIASYFILRMVFSSAKLFSSDENFNTKDFELNLIEKKLNNLENSNPKSQQ